MNTLDLSSVPEYVEVPVDARIAYLVRFALDKHRGDMDFVLHAAKLRIRHNPETWAGWNNVMKHNAGEALTMNMLGTLLKLPEAEVARLERYAFLHNPTICRDVFHKKQRAGRTIPAMEQFTDKEEARLDDEFAVLMQEVDPSGGLRVATSPEFFDQIAAQEGESIEDKADKMPFSELLAYYVDALFDDGTLMAAHERIALMEKRRPDLNADDPRTQRLGMKYWDAERKVSTRIEQRVWEGLKANGVMLASPKDVPEFLRKHIGQAMQKHWDAIQAKKKKA